MQKMSSDKPQGLKKIMYDKIYISSCLARGFLKENPGEGVVLRAVEKRCWLKKKVLDPEGGDPGEGSGRLEAVPNMSKSSQVGIFQSNFDF